MFSVCGVAGLWALQVAAARNELLAISRRDNAASAAEQQKLLSLATNSGPASPAKLRPQNLTQIVKDGAIVCFKDRRGQTAVVQPFGTGRTQWQLAVTCASGGCCRLSGGDASLHYVAADASFLVCQVDGNKFAFRSIGAEGRYLAATRELNEGPVLEHHKLTQAAQWRVTGSGIVNVQFGHKRLGYSVHELKAVPVDAIAAMERAYDVELQSQRDQISQAEALTRSLDRQLQDVTTQLVTSRQELAETAETLSHRWQTAEHHVQQLQQAASVRDEGILQLEGFLEQLKLQHENQERELLAAYDKVAQLQQQLGDLEQESEQKQTDLQDALSGAAAAHDAYVSKLQLLHEERLEQLTARHEADAKHWAELRAKLEYNLHFKDREVEELSGKVHRLDAALREVQRLMYGSSRRQRVDRASLDAVSIHQLQAAVAQFAAAGVTHMDPEAVASSQQESQAIHRLLSSQPFSDGSSTGDLDDQPQQQHKQRHGMGLEHSYDVRDLGWSADQSPGKTDLQGALTTTSSSGLSAAAPHLHDSPLMKLAASMSSSTAMRIGSISSSPAKKQQASAALNNTHMHRSRAGHSAAIPAGGSGWVAAAAAVAGKAAGASSWPSSGTPTRPSQLGTASTAARRVMAAESELSAHWGTDVAVSGSSRRADSTGASSDHAHRYSGSLSDADSQSAADDDDYQHDPDELELIHSACQSLEDNSLRKLFSISTTGSSSGSGSQQQFGAAGSPTASWQRQQPQQEGAGSGAGKQQQSEQQRSLTRLSGGYGRISLTPVKEEQPEQVPNSPPVSLGSLRLGM